jgi:23S rRNA pseudouridine1911/1915/1917 synthase
MQLKETHIVPKLENSIRFQEYAVGIFKIIPTKSGIKKAYQKKTYFYRWKYSFYIKIYFWKRKN